MYSNEKTISATGHRVFPSLSLPVLPPSWAIYCKQGWRGRLCLQGVTDAIDGYCGTTSLWHLKIWQTLSSESMIRTCTIGHRQQAVIIRSFFLFLCFFYLRRRWRSVTTVIAAHVIITNRLYREVEIFFLTYVASADYILCLYWNKNNQ